MSFVTMSKFTFTKLRGQELNTFVKFNENEIRTEPSGLKVSIRMAALIYWHNISFVAMGKSDKAKGKNN